jgi:hypothetical protein
VSLPLKEKMIKKKKLNRKQMLDNLDDAIYQIGYLVHGLNQFPDINQEQFEKEIMKAYQFLNLAVNARHLSEKKYMDLCYVEEKFQEWGNFPDDINLKIVDKKKKF